MEASISKNTLIQQLTRSAHGKLEEYVPAAQAGAHQDPMFFAHLIAWNQAKGEIRDSKVALPVVSLAARGYPAELIENSLAHLSVLDPRNFVRALDFARWMQSGQHQRNKVLRSLVGRYLREREQSFGLWERVVLQHRASMKTLYARFHIAPGGKAGTVFDQALFKGKPPQNSTLALLPLLKDMSPREAAGYIFQRKIPFLVAIGAMGAKLKDETVVLAMIEAMSPQEVVNNVKFLERLGAKTNPAIRGAFEAALAKAATGKGVSTFKTTRAIEALAETQVLTSSIEKLRGVQEKQMKRYGVDGDWLVLADKSGSMERAMETSVMVAATLTKLVKGKVHLIFFDNSPSYVDATGLDLDVLKKGCGHFRADGGTSPGSALQYALERGFNVDGIAMVSDGGERHAPAFTPLYERLCKTLDKEPPVYLYWVNGDPDFLSERMAAAGHTVERFDLRQGVDYYSLPAIVATMSTRRYGLVDQIMDTPLLKLDDVFTVA
jgi:hypothetical protein